MKTRRNEYVSNTTPPARRCRLCRPTCCGYAFAPRHVWPAIKA